MSNSFLTPWTSLLCLWDFPDMNTWVGWHFLFQGIIPTQELNPAFFLSRWILWKWKLLNRVHILCNSMDYTIHGILQARIPKWVAVPFSRGSSQPRDWIQLSSLAGEYFGNESESCSIVSNSLQPHRLYNPWNSPGQNTRVGSSSLLQGIFSTQGLSPGLLHCGGMFYYLSHQGSPPLIISWPGLPKWH